MTRMFGLDRARRALKSFSDPKAPATDRRYSKDPAGGVAGYYRAPSLRGDLLVFISEGDLWRARLDGGPAFRMTATVEEISDPALSPDGRFVAYTARHGALAEVHVMPVDGGQPKQLTHDSDSFVRGWTPDGRVLFANEAWHAPLPARLASVDPDTANLSPLPFDGATHAAFAPDGTAYISRFGLAQFNDNAVLYRGGLMAQLWRFKPGESGHAERLIPDFGAPIEAPMVWGGRIVFISDRSGADNIWSLDPETGETRQHTAFEGWELRGAALDGDRVVYQRGADLYCYDLGKGEETRLPIALVSGREHRRPRFSNAAEQEIESVRVEPTGKCAALATRGRAAVMFTGERRRVDLPVPPLARARSAVFSSDGTSIYLVLDQDRFGDIWRYTADGLGEPEQITFGCDAYIWELYPSPDGRFLLFDDKKGRLWSVELETGERTVLEENVAGLRRRAFWHLAWSRGGRYATYMVSDHRSAHRIVVRDMQTQERHIVTTGKFDSHSPSFSPDGQWLYFLSERHFDAASPHVLSHRAMGTAFEKTTQIFALQLDPDARFAFQADDELMPPHDAAKPDDDTQGKTDTNTPEAPPEADNQANERTPGDKEATEEKRDTPEPDKEIVFEGLTRRLWSVPVAPDEIIGLAAADGLLFIHAVSDGAPRLLTVRTEYSWRARPEVFASFVDRFELSQDRNTVLIHQYGPIGQSVALYPVGPPPANGPSPFSRQTDSFLRLYDWTFDIDPALEWRQMLLDTWRLHRAFSYDPQMRGLDWDALLVKYLPLVDRVGHRSELSDLIKGMIAELGLLHSQVIGGRTSHDWRDGEPACLGADVKPVPGGLLVSRVYRGEADLPDRLGPLAQPHVTVREGDVLKRVDGRPVASLADLSLALRTKPYLQVRLDLERAAETISVIVEPVDFHHNLELRYADWVEQRRERVRHLGGGRIGYLHIEAMGHDDLGQFARDFFDHVDKDGLVIDVRGNTGGNVSSALIHVLLRQVWAFAQWQDGNVPVTLMPQTFRGHLAVLIDQGTYSDGEYFSAAIKALGLAPLIGTRTAGAAIALTRSNRVTDGGVASIGEMPAFDLQGRMIIEGHGIAPTIEVENPPVASFHGEDAQLDAALRYLERRIAEDPLPPLAAAPLPKLGERGEDVG